MQPCRARRRRCEARPCKALGARSICQVRLLCTELLFLLAVTAVTAPGGDTLNPGLQSSQHGTAPLPMGSQPHQLLCIVTGSGSTARYSPGDAVTPSCTFLN